MTETFATIHADLSAWLEMTELLRQRLRIHAHDNGQAADYKTCLNLVADMELMVQRAEALERAWVRMVAKQDVGQ
jgi:hypothetical protein